VSHTTPAQTHTRNQAIDLLRGLVMVLMLLDHTRGFYSFYGSKLMVTLELSTPALFFTRWLTHFCAPVFVFLAGTGAYLHRQKHSPLETAKFLWTRGLWLILLELTLMKFVWAPEPFYLFTPLQVIWVIGCSMIVLGFLCFLPTRITLLFGLFLVVGHHLLDRFDADLFGSYSFLWMLLHEKGIYMWGTRRLFVIYPLIPWIGVMALGFVFGKWIQQERTERKRHVFLLGWSLLIAFVLLRSLFTYGDPLPWQPSPDLLYSILSFINCTKYPPSLLYLLMTIGLSLMLMSWLDREHLGPLGRWLTLLGRVPLFYYIAHLYLLRITGIVTAYILVGTKAFQPPPGPAGKPGADLLSVYLIWIAALIILTPISRWFDKHKRQRTYAWLRYF